MEFDARELFTLEEALICYAALLIRQNAKGDVYHELQLAKGLLTQVKNEEARVEIEEAQNDEAHHRS